MNKNELNDNELINNNINNSLDRVKIVVGDKVSLIVPTINDVNVWYKGVNNTEIQGYLGTVFGTIISKESEEKYYESLNRDEKGLTFSIYINNDNKVIGNISLMNIDYRNSHAELGIAIFDKNNQDKGYGTESIKLIKNYVFDILGLNKLYLKYVSKNERAGIVYGKLGFKEIGRQKEHNYIFGEYYDDVIMEIMMSEYKLETK